jgi:AraC-like DNA-binding protein
MTCATANARKTVSALTARWGLPDAAYFSRAFRAEFGISPREYRLAHGVPEV